MPDDRACVLNPTTFQLASIQKAIDVVDAEIDALGKNDAMVSRLKSVRGVSAMPVPVPMPMRGQR